MKNKWTWPRDHVCQYIIGYVNEDGSVDAASGWGFSWEEEMEVLAEGFRNDQTVLSLLANCVIAGGQRNHFDCVEDFLSDEGVKGHPTALYRGEGKWEEIKRGKLA